MVSTGEVEPAVVVTKLRQALSSINELSAERASLEEALKVEKNRDNILPRIMSISGNYDALFREEIAKYDKLKVCRPATGALQPPFLRQRSRTGFRYDFSRTVGGRGGGGGRSSAARLNDSVHEGNGISMHDGMQIQGIHLS